MSEHRHHWEYVVRTERDFDDAGEVFMDVWEFACRCGEKLGDEHGPINEIEHRLNMMEELTTKMFALEAKLEAMERALYDVAKGMVPNDFSLEGDPREVRSRLFTWSQERAREGLAAAQEEE